MIYGYSAFDADCSLFLRRPWDYLHAVLGITPPIEKGSLSRQVYAFGAFPYHDLSLVMGMDPSKGNLELAVDPAPRAFVVYGAEVADYGAVLGRLAHGYDIHQGALLEQPLVEPLPTRTLLRDTPASIRRFEPNSLLVDVDAKQRGLLVLAEAWYPGWRAEIDGRVSACVPANTWMRAVPVPAGRHQVRVFFHQNYLVPGLLISIVSAGLVLLAVVKPGKRPRPHPTTTRSSTCRPPLSRRPAPGRNQRQGRCQNALALFHGSGNWFAHRSQASCCFHWPPSLRFHVGGDFNPRHGRLRRRLSATWASVCTPNTRSARPLPTTRRPCD